MSIRSLFEMIISKINGGHKDPERSRTDEINTLLIDTFAESTIGDPTSGTQTIDQIRISCARLGMAETKGDLASLLADEISRFDLRDIEMISQVRRGDQRPP